MKFSFKNIYKLNSEDTLPKVFKCSFCVWVQMGGVRRKKKSLFCSESQCRCCSAAEGSPQSLFSTFHRGNAQTVGSSTAQPETLMLQQTN